MLSHSMEISASLTQLFCWLGKSVQPLPSRHPKRFRNAMFQKTQGKQRQTNKGNICGTKILGTQLLRTTQMCQGSTCHVVAQHGDISKLNTALLLTWEVCATIAIKTSKEISQCCSKKHKANKGKPTKATSVTQRFLGRNCWGLHRCVRGQRVMLSHSMEISASLTKLFCWLGKSVQPLPSRHPKRFRNAMFQKTQGKQRQTNKGNICGTKILGTQLLTTQMCRCQGPKVHARTDIHVQTDSR